MAFQIMLDTNIVSVLMRDPAGALRRKVQSFGSDYICISIVTACELKFGVAKDRGARSTLNLETVLASLAVVPFTSPADDEYGRIRAHLARRGTPIGPNDTFIAAHAIALDVTLVTGNVREFSRVPGLRIENWLD